MKTFSLTKEQIKNIFDKIHHELIDETSYTFDCPIDNHVIYINIEGWDCGFGGFKILNLEFETYNYSDGEDEQCLNLTREMIMREFSC